MDDIRIREATLDDLETLLTFEKELIKAERPFDECIREDPVRYYDLRALIEDNQVAVIVAEHEGKILSSGYAHSKNARAYLDHNKYAYLGFMYTIPEFRGKGINLMIIESLTVWALSRGLSELRLTVYEENGPAIRAYEKAGFKKHIIEMRLRQS